MAKVNFLTVHLHVEEIVVRGESFLNLPRGLIVVVAEHDVDLAIQSAEIPLFIVEGEISQVIDAILLADMFVPVLDDGLVHKSTVGDCFLVAFVVGICFEDGRAERTFFKFADSFVSEVRVRREPGYHFSPFLLLTPASDVCQLLDNPLLGPCREGILR